MPCSVNITPLADVDEYLKEYWQSQPGQHYKCLFCPRRFSYIQVLAEHAKRCHVEALFFCRVNLCRKYFCTEKERKTQVETEHAPSKVQNEPFKCIYCNKIIKDKLSDHLQMYHKGEVIRCKYYPSCKILFKTEKEKDKHFDKEHNFGNYSCCFCDKYFENPNGQIIHMRDINSEALKCNARINCPNYFKTEEDRQKHIQEKHPVERKHKCLYCPATYTFHDILHRHMKRDHKDTFIRCERFKCPTYFKSKEERQKHYDEYHKKNKFFCIYCDKVIGHREEVFRVHLKKFHSKEEIFRCIYKQCSTFYKNEEERLAHIKEVHEKNLDEKYRCVYCGIFIAKNLWRHVQNSHSDVAIKCTFTKTCNTYFKTIEDKEGHIKEVHQKIRRPLSCLYCNKIFEGEENFKAHATRMHLDIAIRCQYPNCGQFFKSQADLKIHFVTKPSHKKIVSIKSGSKNLPRSVCCSLCPKTYLTIDSLKIHIRIFHEGKSRVTCPHCQKPVRHKSRHIVNPICRKCNKSFPCMGLLGKHKPTCKPIFPCPVCTKPFKCSAHLQNHCTSVHTAHIKQWKGLQYKSSGHKCDKCFTYFKTRNSFCCHIKNQHNFSLSTCNFCDKQFSKKISVKQHIMSYHLKKLI